MSNEEKLGKLLKPSCKTNRFKFFFVKPLAEKNSKTESHVEPTSNAYMIDFIEILNELYTDTGNNCLLKAPITRSSWRSSLRKPEYWTLLFDEKLEIVTSIKRNDCEYTLSGGEASCISGLFYRFYNENDNVWEMIRV
jgi:hypothetical protein